MSEPSFISNLIGKLVDNLIQPLVTILFVAALVFFLWGMFRFFFYADNEVERAQGKQHMFYGVIGMFIMVSAYSILEVLGRTVGNELPSQDQGIQTFDCDDCSGVDDTFPIAL